MQTPLKTSACYIYKTPPHSQTTAFLNVPSYLKSQYGQRLTNLDDKVTYLEKLLALMRSKPFSPTNEKLIIEKPPQTPEKQEKTLKHNKDSDKIIHEILNSEQILKNLLKLLGIDPEEFQNNFWAVDEAFIIALRDQLNVDRWLKGWKEQISPSSLKSKEFDEFFKEFEDLMFVCVMTIDYLRRFKNKKEYSSSPETKEEVLQVDTIPDYEEIIRKLKNQIRESEEEKALLTRIFSDKVEILNEEIRKLDKKSIEAEEKRNEAVEVIKEAILEKNLLLEEIECLKNKKDVVDVEEDEEKKRKERRKKYALIDTIHEKLKIADRANKLLAEKLEDLMKKEANRR